MNNRQANNNGRRRGRGGQQRPGGSQQGNGNRIDNRARGNAAQLLEKYKNLARDAQMQGDRVNAEYYLQFADHYFRVLSESRARFEEQNPQARRPQEPNGEQEEDFEYDAEARGDDASQGDQRPQREYREAREPRGDRGDRGNRGERAERGDRYEQGDRPDRPERAERNDRPERGERRNGRGNGQAFGGVEQVEGDLGTQENAVEEREERVERPRRTTRARREAPVAAVEENAGLDLAVLPPALGVDTGAAEVEAAEPEKKPRRRRTVRSEETDVPAA